MRDFLQRMYWATRVWFGKADDLKRRVAVENALAAHAKAGTGLTPDECRALAAKLGVPSWYHNRGKRK